MKELIPIIVATAVWGPMWRGQRVRCHCDNMAVIQVFNARTARDSQLMHLLRCLHFIEAAYCFVLVASHVPGIQNELADDLSRNRLCFFCQKATWANPQPFLLALMDPRRD